MVYLRASTTYPHHSRIVLFPLSALLIILITFGKSSADNDNCHQSFATCLDSSKTLELAENSIPNSSEEIKETCDRFNGGMNCVHEYLNTCANNSVRELIERDILGAKRFYQHLCGSKKFQDNYLFHASCLRTTRPDWNDCIRQYRTIIHHEINAPQPEQDPKAAATKYLHYCCAHRAYEKCVLNSAKYKCPPDSVLFIRKVLSMENPSNCVSLDNRYKQNACNGAGVPFNLNANYHHLQLRPVVLIIISGIMHGHHRGLL